MNHAETVREIAVRLPRLKRRDVANVLAVMHELWLEALAVGGEVTVGELGKLVVQRQQFMGKGIVKGKEQSGVHVYLRFRPAKRLRQAIQDSGEER
jgi:nucleoid DNA-binding protein